MEQLLGSLSAAAMHLEAALLHSEAGSAAQQLLVCTYASLSVCVTFCTRGTSACDALQQACPVMRIRCPQATARPPDGTTHISAGQWSPGRGASARYSSTKMCSLAPTCALVHATLELLPLLCSCSSSCHAVTPAAVCCRLGRAGGRRTEAAQKLPQRLRLQRSTSVAARVPCCMIRSAPVALSSADEAVALPLQSDASDAGNGDACQPAFEQRVLPPVQPTPRAQQRPSAGGVADMADTPMAAIALAALGGMSQRMSQPAAAPAVSPARRRYCSPDQAHAFTYSSLLRSDYTAVTSPSPPPHLLEAPSDADTAMLPMSHSQRLCLFVHIF